MTTPTANLGLITYNGVTDASALFQTFRTDLAGNSVASNMGIIDTWSGQVNGSLVALSNISSVAVVSASYVSANYYAASASTITAYKQDMTIILILDTTSDGTVALNINSLGIKSLSKVDVNGDKINLSGHELIKNYPNTFEYDGSGWVWMASSYGDQIGVSGNSTNLTMISGCSMLIDSGISSSSVALVTGSYVVLALNSNLKNEYLLTAGSGITITNNSSASTVTIASFVSSSTVAPSSASYIVLALNPSLSNEWLLTAGNNVTLTQNIDASTIAISTNISASSVATTGSYVMLALNDNVSGEWLLSAGDNIAITQNTNASTVTLSTIVAASSIAPASASYVLLELDPTLQKGLVLTAGSSISITKNTLSGTVTIASTQSASSIAPSTGSYVVLSLNSGLSKEWLLASGSNVSLTQNTSSSTVTISSYYSASSITSYGVDGDLLMISGSGEYAKIVDSDISTYDFVSASAIPAYGDNGNFLMISGSGEDAIMADSGISLYDIISASTVAPSTGSYVVLSLNSGLSNEKVLTAGNNITITQNVSASTVTIASVMSGSSLSIAPVVSGSSLSAVVPVTLGGGGATTAYGIRTNLAVAPLTGSYVVLALNSELSNEWLLTAGNNISLTQNTSSSTVSISSIMSGSSLSVAPVISGSNLSAVVPVTLGGGGATTAAGIRTNLGLGNFSTKNMYTQQVTLSSGGWTTKEQTVSVTSMTSTATVQYGPEPSTSTNRDAYYNADVYCSAQNTGTLTFNYMSSASPTSNIAVNVMFIV
jgi:hypothetical protein